MTKVHVHWTFPEDIFRELSFRVEEGKRSRFVAEATQEALRKLRLTNGIQRAAGAWKRKRHPDLTTKKKVEHYVRNLRKGWDNRAQGADFG